MITQGLNALGALITRGLNALGFGSETPAASDERTALVEGEPRACSVSAETRAPRIREDSRTAMVPELPAEPAALRLALVRVGVEARVATVDQEPGASVAAEGRHATATDRRAAGTEQERRQVVVITESRRGSL